MAPSPVISQGDYARSKDIGKGSCMQADPEEEGDSEGEVIAALIGSISATQRLSRVVWRWRRLAARHKERRRQVKEYQGRQRSKLAGAVVGAWRGEAAEGVQRRLLLELLVEEYAADSLKSCAFKVRGGR